MTAAIRLLDADASPPEGWAELRPAPPNPAGGIDALYLLHDPGDGPVNGLFTRTPIARAAVAATRLRVLHFNDLHNHLSDLPPDGPPVPRFARMADLAAAARAAAGAEEAVLFLSIGDDHTGTVLDELTGWSAGEFEADPSYRAYSAAGVDAAAIGNHEFDRGGAMLALGAAREARFPLLSANIRGSAHMIAGRDHHPAALAVVKGLRIGLIGLTTRVETRTGLASDPGFAVGDPVAALARLLPAFAAVCDVVLVMSHCGYGDGDHASGKSAAARDIGEADFALADKAAELAGGRPVAVLGAHTHTRLNEHGLTPENLRGGVPILQAECNGRFLGELVVTPAAPEPAERYAARLIPMDGPVSSGAQAFEARHVAPLLDAVSERMRAPLGRLAASGLDAATVIDARYGRETGLANYMNDAILRRLAGRLDRPPELSALNAASILAGVAGETVTFGDWFRVMPYADEVFVTQATPGDIAAILASNATRILRAEETGVDRAGFLPRGFLHFSEGLRYEIDPGASAAEARAVNIRLFGKPLADWPEDRRFGVAMTTYLALGSFGERWNGMPVSGGVPGAVGGYDLRALPHENTGLIWRSELAEQIRAEGGIAAHPSGWLDGRLRVRDAAGRAR